ncbi:beta strand repeat-containing protein [Klebsiella pneumoniae subsp. pneumoniae]|uniref:beta strand repeat-containing protein n=1 Tax=Klebsiella pneumoniae TaxID=573 RepID=UPI003B2800B9
MASLAAQHQIAALDYGLFGYVTSAIGLNVDGRALDNGTLTPEQYVRSQFTSSFWFEYYYGHSEEEIVQSVYTRVYGSAPSESDVSKYLNMTNFEDALTSIINGLIYYNGTDPSIISQQYAFENEVAKTLYPAANGNSLGQGASDYQAIMHVTGATLESSGLNYWGARLNQDLTITRVAQVVVNSKSYLSSLSNDDFIARIFQQGFEREPTGAELSAYRNLLQSGSTRGDLIVKLIDSLKGTVSAGDLDAQNHFNNAAEVFAAGSLPDLQFLEQAAAVYLAVPGRVIDASGLDTWSKSLAGGKTYSSVIGKLLSSKEFLRKGAELSGNDFIQHVYALLHGTEASEAILNEYAALGTNKSVITAKIINDLRSSMATEAVTVTQQHSFENDIGTSLLYKTGAILTTTAGGGNATGTVNTNTSHQISNAETAVLTNVQLNANAVATVDLKFADHLANLEIGGSSASIINLSDNGINPGVSIIVNNGGVTLNASSGADEVLLTTGAVVASAAGTFNLGAGNDSLKWLGNGVSDGANTVSTNLTANGGDDIDIISANLITKDVVISGNAFSRTATISTNTAQFSSFEKLDLAGYVGKATVSSGSTAENHTFDFGILTGNAVSESSASGLANSVVQAATSNIGSQGFVLSGIADQVHVINAAGGNSAQLQVTGNATATSSVDITFLQNATDHFDLNFTASSDTNVDAGAISLNSSSSVLLGTALTDINISSSGVGDFENLLSLVGTNAQVESISITGDHVLKLNLGSGFSNVRTIDASGNTAGFSLNSGHGGTGDGIIVQLLNTLTLSTVTTGLLTPVLNSLGLNGYQLDVTGSSANDTFSIIGNTTITGGTGVNTYELIASNSQAGVTITDFDSAKDVIVNVSSGLTVSGDSSGEAVGDYGTHSSDTLDALLGLLLGGLTTGVVGLLGGILGLGSSNSLMSKVGIASVVFSGSGDNADSYLIIDNNDDHTLDVNDTVVFLTGQNHQQLVDALHYA